jgi:hypothetical protein
MPPRLVCLNSNHRVSLRRIWSAAALFTLSHEGLPPPQPIHTARVTFLAIILLGTSRPMYAFRKYNIRSRAIPPCPIFPKMSDPFSS